MRWQSAVRAACGSLVIAVFLVSAPSAFAEEFVADTESTATITGSALTESVLTIESGGLSAKCKKASFTGSLSAPSESLTLAPTLSECSAFGFTGSTVSSTGCNLVLHAGKETAENEFSGTADLSCEKPITVTTATCEVQIGTQSGLGSVTYVDETTASPEDFTAALSLTKLKYTETKDGIGCPLTRLNIAQEDGTWKLSERFIAKVGAAQVGARVGRRTMLCKSPPVANVCAAAERYSGAIEGTLKNGPAAIEAKDNTGAAIGAISCESVVFKGNFQRNGASTAGEGITSFKWESPLNLPSGKCTSTLAGNPEVTVAMQNLPYANSRFQFNPAGPGNGTLFFRKAGGNFGLNLEIGAAAPCDYRLNPVSGTMTNGAAGVASTLQLPGGWTLFEGKEPPCPFRLNWNLAFAMTRTMGPLYIAER